MINFDANLEVLIAITPIDFRAGINKLGMLAEKLFNKNPRLNGVFVFRNKKGTDIKLILYHTNGYFMGHKRLSKGKLSWWPRTEKEALNISPDELLGLLKGVDPRGTFHPDWNGIYKKDLGENGFKGAKDKFIDRGSFEFERSNPNGLPIR